ncbi:MAG: thiol:disulfide interchange protein DsbA/DsbL [Pseudomonadota bacterium]
MLSGKNSLRSLLVVVYVLLSAGVYAQVERFVEGVHYTTLPASTYAKGLNTTDDKVDVTEVFWYGCPHCYAFDPLLESWADEQAANISFTRTPLMVWSAMNKQHARLFYAVQQLGKTDTLHSIIFDEVQKNRKPLADESTAAELVANYGVAATDFTSAYNSFTVDTLLRKAEAMQKEIPIPSVPVLIVNGKYMVEGNEAVPGHEDMLEVVEFLVLKEKAAS